MKIVFFLGCLIIASAWYALGLSYITYVPHPEFETLTVIEPQDEFIKKEWNRELVSMLTMGLSIIALCLVLQRLGDPPHEPKSNRVLWWLGAIACMGSFCAVALSLDPLFQDQNRNIRSSLYLLLLLWPAPLILAYDFWNRFRDPCESEDWEVLSTFNERNSS